MRLVLIALLLIAQPLQAVEYLAQSTAVTVKLGPFVDSTDGVTAESSLTLSQADFRLSKNGGDIAQKNQSSSATHDELGVYDVSLNATDTNTLGRLRIDVQESGALPVWKEFMVLDAGSYNREVLGYEYGPTGQRIFFVDTAGNDSNAGTRALPKLTVQAAVTAATDGDIIHVNAGTYNGQITIPDDKNGLTIEGDGHRTVLVYSTGAQYAWVVFLSDGCTLRDVRVVSTGTGQGVASYDLEGTGLATNYITIERCHIDGEWDAIYTPNCSHLKISRVTASATYDVINCSGANGIIDNTLLYTDGSYGGGTAYPSRGIVWTQSSTGGALEVRNTRIAVTKTANSTAVVAGITAGDVFGTYPQALLLENVVISVTSTHASSTGQVSGIRLEDGGSPVNNFTLDMRGGSITTSAAGSATVLDVDINGNASAKALLAGTVANDAKFSGDVVIVDEDVSDILVDTGTTGVQIPAGEIDATAIADNAIDAGAIAADAITNAKIAAGAIASGTEATGFGTAQTGDTYAIANSGTHGNAALKTLVDAKASQSSVDSKPSAAENASAVVAKSEFTSLANNASSAKSNTDALPGMIAGGKFTAQALEEAPASGGGTTVPVNQVACGPSRTWKLITKGAALVGELPLFCTVEDDPIYAIDFSADLPTNGRLTDFLEIEILSAVDADGDPIEDGLEFDISGADTFGVDKAQAKLKITAVTAGTYELRAKVQYRDGDGGGTRRGKVKLIVGE
jgi:hypothetical protein